MLAVTFRGIDGETHLIEQIPSDVALRESAHVTTVGGRLFAHTVTSHIKHMVCNQNYEKPLEKQLF